MESTKVVGEVGKVETIAKCCRLVLFAICEVDVVLEAPHATLTHGYVIGLGFGLGTLTKEIHFSSNASNHTRPIIHPSSYHITSMI